jgi:hypothetical protein
LLSLDHQAIPAAIAAELPPELPRLTGILILPDRRKAIFQLVGDEPQTVVDEGAMIGDWRVRDIEMDGLILANAQNAFRLTPSFASRPDAVELSVASEGSQDDIQAAEPQMLEKIFEEKSAHQPVIGDWSFDMVISAAAAQMRFADH